MNLELTASGNPNAAVVSSTVTQIIPYTIVGNFTSSIAQQSAPSSGNMIFTISVPSSPSWELGVFIQVDAIEGDPDLYISLTDQYVKTSDWSSRRHANFLSFLFFFFSFYTDLVLGTEMIDWELYLTKLLMKAIHKYSYQ